MARIFSVQSIRFRHNQSSESRVRDLGFSVIRLKRLSGGIATGVRANLKIRDQDALTALGAYYDEHEDLNWTFGIGSSPTAVSVDLRFTRFHKLSGSVQLARTAVMRDLIEEIEEAKSDTSGDPDLARSAASPLSSDVSNRCVRDRSIRSNDDPHDVAALWPKIFG